MFTRNVPNGERAVRALGGIALLALGLLAMKGTVLGYLLAASGAVGVVTGFLGFCPLCALAGRRIAQNIKKRQEENG